MPDLLKQHFPHHVKAPDKLGINNPVVDHITFLSGDQDATLLHHG
jgi:hypothetical protein